MTSFQSYSSHPKTTVHGFQNVTSTPVYTGNTEFPNSIRKTEFQDHVRNIDSSACAPLLQGTHNAMPTHNAASSHCHNLSATQPGFSSFNEFISYRISHKHNVSQNHRLPKLSTLPTFADESLEWRIFGTLLTQQSIITTR